ncbi:hypothetical protein [Goodfellowiella coeruleoviolacea]|uniref:hypothetical protein n=1 Tax=Goodfellowiella coeruleoviolacea TaxID=334858 RepID=UPI0020A32543|nr:hypothetical protein [Goodfellowiella coeruleoviolacea]
MEKAPGEHDDRIRLEFLAHSVMSELAVAGLPVVPSDSHPKGTAGAMVSVDMPGMSGVVVHWHVHAILMDAAQEAWADDPLNEGPENRGFRQLFTTIGGAMQEAMYTILCAAGFEVSKQTDSDELLVTGRAAGSLWEERRNRQFERRYEKKAAAWNRRHEECAAADARGQDVPENADDSGDAGPVT